MSVCSFCIKGSNLKHIFSQNVAQFRPQIFVYRNFKKHSLNSKLKILERNPAKSFQRRRLIVFFKTSAFTSGACFTAFIGSSIWRYENLAHDEEKTILSSIQSFWNEIEGFDSKKGNFRKWLNEWWNQTPDGLRVFWAICAVNFCVLIFWKHPSLRNFMQNYFTSSPFGKFICWPMLFSVFSHYSAIHCALNMFVLHSFCTMTSHSLGKEQFVAFYLSGGIISSYSSHLIKLIRISKVPSVGASGAILALLGYFCTKYPNAQLGIVFLPNFTFDAKSALGGIMLIDLLGIIFKWKILDHAAHLGGAAFGVFYALYGQDYFLSKHYYITDTWMRGKQKYQNLLKKD